MFVIKITPFTLLTILSVSHIRSHFGLMLLLATLQAFVARRRSPTKKKELSKKECSEVKKKIKKDDRKEIQRFES